MLPAAATSAHQVFARRRAGRANGSDALAAAMVGDSRLIFKR
ncbi:MULTISPECIES: hypothetical protein [unclassified Frankia]